MDNSQFDQWLRDKMSRLEGEIPPADWGRMKERLNEEDWIDAQNEQAADFDQAIRQRISNTPPAAPANWDFMAEKLDQEFGPETLNDVILDGVVYEQLHQYQAPYNAAHWPIMEQRIKESYSIRRKLVKYKVAEVSLMLLLIFTLLQYLPYYPAKKKSVDATTQQHQPFAANVLPAAPSYENHQSVLDNDAVSPIDNSVNSTIEQNKTARSTAQSANVISPEDNQSLPTVAEQSALINTTDREAIKSLKKITPPATVNEQKSNVPTETLETTRPLIKPPSSYGSNQASILSSFDMLALLAADQLPEPEKLLPDCIICPKISKHKSWQVGMVVASDMNYINPTTAEFRFRLPDYDEINTGYGGGLTVTIPVTNRWAFETGLIYASAYYLPDEINASLQGSFTGGFSAVGFHSAQLHLLKVPLQAQYAFNPNNSRWKWYGVLGASVNATMIQEYYYRSIPEPSFLGNTNTSSPRSPSNLAAELSDEFKGLLDNGQAVDNLQVTANIGLGLERYFSPRWSIFIQPVYQHDLRLQSLQGFGPYQDRINSLSFYFGSKVTLK